MFLNTPLGVFGNMQKFWCIHFKSVCIIFVNSLIKVIFKKLIVQKYSVVAC